MEWKTCHGKGGEAAGREAGRTARSWHTHVPVPASPGEGSAFPGIELGMEDGSCTSHTDPPLGKEILHLARIR